MNHFENLTTQSFNNVYSGSDTFADVPAHHDCFPYVEELLNTMLAIPIVHWPDNNKRKFQTLLRWEILTTSAILPVSCFRGEWFYDDVAIVFKGIFRRNPRQDCSIRES